MVKKNYICTVTSIKTTKVVSTAEVVAGSEDEARALTQKEIDNWDNQVRFDVMKSCGERGTLLEVETTIDVKEAQ